MKIPDNVRINGVDYAVKWVKDLNDGAIMLHGLFDSCNSTISLNPKSQEYQQQCITFLHELFHAVIYSYQINLVSEAKEVIIPKEEEKLVELLARGFYQVIQDNGKNLFSDICDASEKQGKGEE